MDQLLLGIDLGTGSSKALLATPDGTVVASASRAHTTSTPRPGRAEVDAQGVWWAEVAALSSELVGQVGAERVAGVCVSGVGPCLVLTDEQLQPVRPAILYGIDMRATAEIEELTRRFGAQRIMQRGGSALSSQAVGPKLLWVRRREPDTWARAARFFGSSSYVVARLTGAYVLDHHTASQYDPLYDMRAQDWAHDWLAEVAPGLEPPRLLWPSQVAGTVHAAAAEATGLRPGTPVSAGTVDAWAEAFSAGVRAPGDLMLMYGSTTFFVQVLPELRSDPALWTTAGVDPGTWTFAAGTNTSGSLTGWVQQLTGGAPFADLVREAAATPPGAHGLLLLPYFAGERMPVSDPQARGVVVGLSLQHGRGHLFRAAYEGIAYGIRQILEFLDAAGGTPARIVAAGGGTQGGLWTQIVTDVTGREQQLPDLTVGASYGSALLAAIGSGLVPPTTDWARVTRTLTPDPTARALYDDLYPTYRALYPDNREHLHRLAALQEAQAGV